MKQRADKNPKKPAAKAESAGKAPIRDAGGGPLSDPFIRRQAIILFALAALLYVNTLGFDFNLDDGVVITGNKYTQKGLSGIPDILTHDAFVGYFGEGQRLELSRYRPLTQVLFAVQYQLFGLKPFIGHLTNVLFYGITCVVLFLLLHRLFKPETKSFLSVPFLATALFAAHPLHTEVVANIKGLDEIFSLLASLITLYWAVEYAQSRQSLHRVWIALAFFAAMLSKEAPVTLFAVAPLTLYCFTPATRKEYLNVLASLGVAFAAYLALRFNAVGLSFPVGSEGGELLNNPFADATFAEKYATVMYTWGKYLWLVWFPHPLTHDYYPKQVPIIGWADLRAIVPLVLYLALAAYAMVRIWKKDVIAFGILFFLFTFSISSNLIVSVGTFMNERFMFAPLAGFCVAAAYVLSVKLPLFVRQPAVHRNAVIGVMALLLLGYSLKTVTRNAVWKDGYTLFTSDVTISTNSAKANISAGGLLMERALKETDPAVKNDQVSKAVLYLGRAAAIHPMSITAWNLLGRAQIEANDLANAAKSIEEALKMQPSNFEAVNYMLFVAQKNIEAKQYAAAIENHKTLIKYQPKRLEYSLNLAAVYEAAGQLDNSASVLNGIVAEDPSYVAAYSRLGELYAKRYSDVDKAIPYFSKAFSLDSKNSAVLENLGVAYGMKGNFKESLEYFNRAIEVTPNNPQLYRNVAALYKSLRMPDKETEALLKAEQLEKRQ